MKSAEKVFEVLGFREKPARWWAWTGIVFIVVVAVVVFFLSYSLARHKRLVARLEAKITEQGAIINVQRIQLKKKDEEIKIASLRRDDEVARKKREKLRDKILQYKKDEDKARRDLARKRKRLGKDSTDQLIQKAKKIVKETL
jgi:biopolymer transport protein ExbB/TolQ